MKYEIQRAILVILCVILSAIVCIIFADSLLAKHEEIRQTIKNEPIEIEVIESEPQIFTVTIPLSSIRVMDAPIVEIAEVTENTEEMAELEDEETEEVPPKKFTDEDAIAMAKLLYGEARGVKDLYIWDGRVISSEYQQACVIWSVLNRYDAGWENSIIATVSAYKQFHGYSPNNPVMDDLLELSYDVLERWNREQYGETEVGRVLPPEYLYFYGDNRTNWFMDEYGDSYKYNWDLADPYK